MTLEIQRNSHTLPQTLTNFRGDILEQIRSHLIRIFAESLDIEPKNVPGSTMDNTESWDSFAHMTLIVAVESDLLPKPISADDIVTLTSFDQVLSYVLDSCR